MTSDHPYPNGALIQLEDVTKVYQMGEVQVHALRGVSLSVREGEYLAIMGATWSLTNDANDHSPVFSPDGSQIAVSYWQNDHWEIHVMNADTLTGTLARVAEPGRAGGTGRMRLTQTSIRAILEQQVKGQMPKAWNNAAPAWSPDGLQIAFLTDRTGQWEIWVMPAPGTQAQVNADGTNQHPLLPSEVQAQLHLQYNGMEERMLAWR